MDILERLQQYNPPDRTVDSQRQISVDIWEAVDRIKALEAEVERLKKRAEFMGHCNSCALHPSKTSSDTTRCTCGLDELLAEE